MSANSIAGRGELTGMVIPPVSPEVMAAHAAKASISQSAPNVTGIAQEKLWSLLTGILTRNIKNLPKYLKKNWVWLLPLAVLWLVLWIIPMMTRFTFPKTIDSLISLLIFLTAGYNNFLGKALYIGIINSTIIPVFKELKTNGIMSLWGRYKQTTGLIMRSYKTLGRKGIVILLIFAGIGFAFSNLITRNNKIDKYLICLMVGTALFNSLSNGVRDMTIRVVSSAYSLAMRLAGQSNVTTFKYLYAIISAFSLGTVLSFIPGEFSRNYYDYTGYIAGIICILAGVAVHFVFAFGVKKHDAKG